MQRTSRKDYERHQYSGPRKSRKRVYAQMKRYHGEVKSRSEVWGRTSAGDRVSNETPVLPSTSSGSSVNKTSKQYGGSKKKYRVEATWPRNDQQLKEAEVSSLPVNINWPEADPAIENEKNHVIKNYTGALYKILSNTKLPLLGRKLVKPKLTKLTAVARKIIIQGDHTTMREDLKNGPNHVFGCHTDCKEYYCRFVNSDEEDVNSLSELKTKAPTVWALISAANEAVMSKCHRLSNDTTNVVENFMSVLSKFICGKRLNLHKGGSYQRRVYVAGQNLI